jgi:large subunit ribosomal protein L9
MELILREEIKNLGNRGEIVNVADGYARNFLLPRRLAVPATEANKKIVEQERMAHVRREAKQKGEAEDLAKQLNGVTVTFTQKAGEADQLFGSVTAKDIVEALAKQDFVIDRRKIHLDEPIKQLGEHKVAVKLHPDVSVEIQVNVLREAEE